MYTKAQIDSTATTMGLEASSLNGDQRIAIAGLMLQAYTSGVLAADQATMARMATAAEGMKTALSPPPPTPAP